MGKLDISKLAEKLAELDRNSGGNRGGNMGFLNLKDGRNVLRVLPPKGDNDFYLETLVHYGVGKNEQNKKGKMVVCPTTYGEDKPCPICETVQELYDLSSAKDDSYEKQARSLRRKKRIYYNAISRDEDLTVYEKNEEEGKWIDTTTNEEGSPVKVWATGAGIFKDILKLIVDPEYGDITHAEEGLDLIVTKSGSGQYSTKYDVKTVRKESPIGFDEWEECLHDLSSLGKVKTYKQLEAIMQGEEESDSGDDSNDNGDYSSNEESASPESDKIKDEPKDEAPAKEAEPDTSDDEDGLQADIRAALERRKNKNK